MADCQLTETAESETTYYGTTGTDYYGTDTGHLHLYVL